MKPVRSLYRRNAKDRGKKRQEKQAKKRRKQKGKQLLSTLRTQQQEVERSKILGKTVGLIGRFASIIYNTFSDDGTDIVLGIISTSIAGSQSGVTNIPKKYHQLLQDIINESLRIDDWILFKYVHLCLIEAYLKANDRFLLVTNSLLVTLLQATYNTYDGWMDAV